MVLEPPLLRLDQSLVVFLEWWMTLQQAVNSHHASVSREHDLSKKMHFLYEQLRVKECINVFKALYYEQSVIK